MAYADQRPVVKSDQNKKKKKLQITNESTPKTKTETATDKSIPQKND